MLRFFQNAYLSQYTALFIFTMVCWAPSFILSAGFDAGASPALDYLAHHGFSNAYLTNAIALILTIIIALFVNNVAGDLGFSSKLSTTTMLFFLLFTSSLTTFTTLNPYIIINVFLLFFIRNLFSLSAAENTIPTVFNSALMLGISALLYLPVIILVICIWLALIIHRSNAWRNYAVSIIGVFLPQVFMMTWYFWDDEFGVYLSLWDELLTIGANLNQFDVSLDLIISLLFLLLFIITSFSTMGRLVEKNITLRRNLIISLYFLLFTFFIVLFFSTTLTPLLIIAIPGSLIFTNFIKDVKHIKFYNLTFVIIMMLIFFNQYFRLVQTFIINAY